MVKKLADRQACTLGTVSNGEVKDLHFAGESGTITSAGRISKATSAILFLSSKHGFTSTNSSAIVFGKSKRPFKIPFISSGLNPPFTGVPVPYDVKSGSIESTSKET